MGLRIYLIISLIIVTPLLGQSQDDVESWLKQRTPKETFSTQLLLLTGNFKNIFPNLSEDEIQGILNESIDSIYDDVCKEAAIAYQKAFSKKELKKIMTMAPEEIIKKYEKEMSDIMTEQMNLVSKLSEKHLPVITKKLRVMDFHKEAFISDSCMNFRYGTYTFTNVPVETEITRYGDTQIEIVETKRTTTEVNWNNGCYYTLKIIDTEFEEAKSSIGSVVHVKIFEINGNEYKLKAYSEHYKDAFILEVKKLKD